MFASSVIGFVGRFRATDFNMTYYIPRINVKGISESSFGLIGTDGKLELAPGVHWLDQLQVGEYHVEARRSTRCQTYDNDNNMCYTYHNEGLFFSKSVQVSQYFSCPKHCLVHMESTLISTSAKYIPIDFALWTSLTRPRLPSTLRVYSELESSIKINLTLSGPTKGYIWFKPIYWMMSGRYKIVNKNQLPLYEVSSPIETFLPVSYDGSHVGIFGFQEALPMYNPRPITAPKLNIHFL
ncbi:hypothetical protein DSO57_1026306 [Entomophthora muscae]|uniref:Uncharacterized protein n=1 Tax=Entomophthora muscae TaxID=34485 RepID=A0ACC2TZY4_9FUNG|nr:hypothetical protein DSO57_1026306 [Entomophthora muscae]